MNTVKCKDCKNYDQIKGGKVKSKHGWCIVKSVYPFKDSIGQVAPPNARRVTSAEMPSRPEIVEGEKVISNCYLVNPK